MLLGNDARMESIRSRLDVSCCARMKIRVFHPAQKIQGKIFFGLAFGSLEFRIKLKLFSGGCVLRLYLSKKIWRRGKSWRIQGVVYIPQHRNLHSMLYGVS